MLLKAVIGVMEPRSGKIERNGNISALLELASGFDGDLTVKENAYLRGAMLGYTKEFMDETYEQILDFSELREFEERPFKQLSTGMQSRLAFSIRFHMVLMLQMPHRPFLQSNILEIPDLIADRDMLRSGSFFCWSIRWYA